MATFKIKDLMINLGDRADIGCALQTIHQCVLHTTQTLCHSPTWWQCLCPTHWGMTYVTTPTIIDRTTPVQQVSTPEEIHVLRKQLKEQLALLDQKEKVINEELQPKTLADLNLIEEKLRESLEEIRNMKDNF
jgi:hypothetical protein